MAPQWTPPRPGFLTAGALLAASALSGCVTPSIPTANTSPTQRPKIAAQANRRTTVTAARPIAAAVAPAQKSKPKATPSLVRHVAHEEVADAAPLGLPIEIETSTEVTPVPPQMMLTLDQAIHSCLQNDPKLHVGVEEVTQANADLLTSSLRPNPTVTIDGQTLRLNRPVLGNAGPPQFDAGVTFPIDWYVFGKRAAAMCVASLGTQVSEAEYADLIRRRVADTALAYYDVVEAESLALLARQDVANLRRVEQVTATAVEDGGKPRVDLNRVRLDLLVSRKTLREAESTVVSATARLRALLGYTDADPQFRVDANLAPPLQQSELSPGDAFSRAVQNRPDLEALRKRSLQANASIDLERRKGYPEITPGLTYTKQWQAYQGDGFPDTSTWGAQVSMPLQFFDRNQGNRAKAESLAIQAQHKLRATEVELQSEVTTVLQDLRTARANAEGVAGEQLKLAGEVRDSITKAYEAGGRPLIDVLDAQRNYRETFRVYILSRAGYWRAFYRFQSVIGEETRGAK